ncbi:hypothetical protein BGZ47_011751 [Haplosporangium gracile]|nr:hypothetical protein BGZ47_011751 [Haplosporangium gracile]
MTDNILSLFYLVDGLPLSRALEIEVSATRTIAHLKDLIKTKQAPTFDDIRAAQLTLWRVSIPDGNQNSAITIAALNDKTELNNPGTQLSKLFPEIPHDSTYIIVQRPPPSHAPLRARNSTLRPGHLPDESVRKAPPKSPMLAREAFNTVLKRLEKDIFYADTSISRFLHSFVKGDLSIPDADCCVRGLPRAWLRSRTESTQPALYLLHPRRPHQTTTTPPSVTALRTLEKFQNNDMITFLGVNGCGKTRAVVEMLAQNWGFYLNGSQTDRGSKDFTTLFDLGHHDTFTCDRWMLFQVCPGAFDAAVPDVFDIVFRAILRAFHDQTPPLPFPSLKALLQDRFRQVQGQMSSFSSDTLTNKLLVVLDEAQTLSDHGREFFVLRVDLRDPTSILSPIIHGLRSISDSESDYCVVTCDAGISADELELLVGSGGIGEHFDQLDDQIVNFPGWDTENRVAMYINSLGDAMSEDDRVRLHTLIPEAAVEELFFKLRGHFRPIVSTIKDIIAKGSTSYWSEAIERNADLALWMLDKATRDPTKYADAVKLKHFLKQIVVHRASLGLPWSLERNEPILVESAFGRLRITADKPAWEKTTSTIVDEPFVFQGAYNFIKNEDKEFYKHFSEQYRDLQDPQFEGELFERHAPLDLIYAFHKKQLKQELFSIPKAAAYTMKPKTPITQSEPVTFPRHLFEYPATIVGWEESFQSGPDIVFVLQIEDQLYPVFVQTKCLDGIYPGGVEKARLTVHETTLKAHLPNLATYCPGGKYLSLIYVHPTIVKTPREGWDGDDLWDSEFGIRADHNQGLEDGDMPLMQLLMIIDGSNIRNFVPGGVVDLLDSVKSVKRVHDWLGLSGRADKRPMLTK